MALRHRLPFAALVACALGLSTNPVLAQPASSGEKPSKEALEEARTRYERGTQLYNEGDHKLALIEFQRAYELAPNFKILFNIAQVNLQLGSYAAARRAFERYLKEGGSEIPDRRKAEVEKELAGLRARTAHVTVVADVDGAEIQLDGNVVGTTPLSESLLVDAGQHTVALKREGRVPASKTITLAGTDEVKIEFELPVQPTPVVPAQNGPIRETKTIIQPEKSSYVWVGWVVTGTFAAGATATGIVTLALSRDLKSSREKPLGATETPEAKRADLDDRQNKARALAITTDILIGSAVVAGAVSLYFTLKSDSSDHGKDKTARVVPLRVGVGANRLDLSGAF